MTPTEYRANIATLGLSQERAGPALGVSPRTSQAYALGETPIPEPIVKLLTMLIERKARGE